MAAIVVGEVESMVIKRFSNACPKSGCRADRQSEINAALGATIPPDAKIRIERFRVANVKPNDRLMRCSYCACVYFRMTGRDQIIGWLDDGADGQHWKESSEWLALAK